MVISTQFCCFKYERIFDFYDFIMAFNGFSLTITKWQLVTWKFVFIISENVFLNDSRNGKMTQHVKLPALKPEDKLDFQNLQDERRESASVICPHVLFPQQNTYM